MSLPAQKNTQKNKQSQYNFHKFNYLKVSQASKILGISPSSLRRFEEEGKITSERLPGNNYRVYRLDLVNDFKAHLNEVKKLPTLEKKLMRKALVEQKQAAPEVVVIKPIVTNNARVEDTNAWVEEVRVAKPWTKFKFNLKLAPTLAIASILITLFSLLFLPSNVSKSFSNVKGILSAIPNTFKLSNDKNIENKKGGIKLSNVLAARTGIADFVENFNLPVFFSELAVFEQGLTTTGVTFNGTGLINNLLGIDAVTKTTLENNLSIDGEVIGTDMLNTVIADGIIDGTNLAPDVAYDGNFDFTGTIAIGGASIDATAEELNYLSGATVNAGGVVFGDGSTFTQDASSFYWNNISKSLGIGTTNPTSQLTITPSSAGAVQINPFGTLSGNTGELRFNELLTNGTNYVGFKAPDSLAQNVIYTLPSTSALEDYVLTWKPGDILTWSSSNGDISSVGSFESGRAFSGTDSDNQWLGLGASAGRIEFDDQTTDEINFLNAYVGIGTSTPQFTLDVNGNINTLGLYLSGTQVTATATELNLLDGRTGILVDSNNVSSYSITSLTAGLGFLGGTGPGAISIDIGAGDGISVAADSLSLDILTTGTSVNTNSNSGLELSSDGLRLLGGCSNDQVLSWNSSSQVWECGSKIALGGTTGSGAANQIAFWSGSSTLTGSNNFYLDVAQSRLGIGLTNPSVALDVSGSILATGSINGLTISSGNITAGTWNGDVINVNKGGTGNATLTQYGVLVGAGTGSVSGITAGVSGQLLLGLTGSNPAFGTMSGDATISNNGTLTLSSTSVAAGTYGSSTLIPVITVDSKGRVTLASNAAGDFQPSNTYLSTIAGLTPADSNFIVGNGTTWTVESGATARTSLGLGTGDSPNFAGLYISGTQVTAMASELNILDGAMISTTELNLLDNRSGTLVDSNNVSSYATTGVTAGSGLTDGGTTGVLTLNIGAGNGVVVGADSISLDIVTTGTSASTNSNSGLELSADGVRLLGGCTGSQVLAWNSGTSVWECKSVSSIGSTVSGSGVVNQLAFFTGLNSVSGITAGNNGQILVGLTGSSPSFATLTGDATIAEDGTLTLTSTSAIAGTYGNTTNIPTITVDAKGRITSIVNTAISYESPLTFSNGITRTTNAIKLGGTFTESTTLTAGNFDAIFNLNGTGDFRVQDNGVDVLFVKDDGNVGIGTSNPTYKLTVSGSASTSSLFTTDLFIAGTQVTSTAAELNVLDGINATLTASELNILDGAMISTTELNLLDNRTGTLVDSNNVSSYATTGVTAGSGLTDGGTTGVLTLNIGAGNGVVVGADSISLDIVTTGTSASTNSNSGLELSADGVRLLGGCGSEQVLAWNSGTNVWECKSVSSIGSTVSGSGVVNQLAFFTGLNSVSGITAGVNGQILVGLTGSSPSFATLTGDATIAEDGTLTLTSTSAIAGTYGNTTNIPTITVDAKGRVTSILNTAISYESPLTFSNGITRTTNAIKLGGTFTESTTLTAGNFDAIFNLNGTGDFRVQSSGVDAFFVKENGNVGIGTSNPTYKLTVSGSASTSSLFTTDLFIAGTQVTATAAELNVLDGINATLTASELNILDGALISTTELNLLDNRSGTLVDSNNVSSYATTGVTAGSGLTDGGTTGVLTLNIGAGNGVVVGADSISLDIVTTGTSASTNSNSGLELSADGVRLLGGCSSSQVLAWNSGTNVWECKSVNTLSSTVSGSGVAGQVTFWNSESTINGDPGFYWNNTSKQLGIGTSSPTSKLTITPSSAGALQINPFGTSAGDTGEFRLSELVANGTNYTGFKAPDLLDANVIYTLPSTSGSLDYVLTWQSGNVMQWKEVTGVGGTGDITDVGSVSSGKAFSNTAADGQWLGLGANAGRIEFDNEATNEVNILGANVGIGTSTPLYTLDVNGNINTTGLYIGGSQVTSSALELNILDGATLSTTELNLLDGRTGTLVDSNNISSYATTGVTAGSGLTDGGTTGVLTLNIGGGNGIVVGADSISLDIVTTGTSSNNNSNSGLELSADGLRLLGGCSSSQVLAWNSGTNVWECKSVNTLSSTVSGSGIANQLAFFTGLNSVSGITAGNNGQILVGLTGSSPSFATLTGDATIAEDGTLTLTSTSAIAGTYGNTTNIPTITVDAKGRITSIVNTAISYESPLTFSNGITRTTNAIKLGGTFTESTTLTAGNFDAIFNLNGTGDFRVQSSGVDAFFVKENGNVGIGTSNPTYKLTVSGSASTSSLFTTDLFIAGTQVTSTAAELNVLDGINATLTASELNILDGALISTTELNLLDNRTGTLLDNSNVGTYAITSITAGSGISSTGTGPGALTINIGAGSGITVAADSISIDSVTTGTSANTNSNSGLELSADGLRLLGGCTGSQVLAWNSGTSVWECKTVNTLSSTLSGSGVANQLAVFTGLNSLTGLSAGTTGQLLLGLTGSNPTFSSMSGDATISNAGVLTLSSTSAIAGTYGNTTNIPTITVDSKGRVTSILNTAISYESPLTFSNGITRSTNAIKLGGTFTESTTLTAGAYDAIFNLNGTGDFRIQDNGVDKFVVTDTGLVGIGTSAPKNALDVSGGMALGSYAGVNTSPSNGLIVSGNVGIGTVNPQDTLDVNGSIITTGIQDLAKVNQVFLSLPSGDTLNIDSMEYASDDAARAAYVPSNSASGGTVTTAPGDYLIHTFTSPGTFAVTGSFPVEALIVAGGGGGGWGYGGGGGAGGVVYNAALALTTGNKTVTVGSGGPGGINASNAGTDGGNSILTGAVTAVGGGGGASADSYWDGVNGRPGGSGGGGGGYNAGATGYGGDADYLSPRQGYDGGTRGSNIGKDAGGGGAGEVGHNYVTGGDGTSAYSSLLIEANAGVDIAGTHWIAGGGGGSADGGASPGGNGGGGTNGGAGTANTGGGGGGGGAGAGGSGIVIAKYYTNQARFSSATKNQGSYSLKETAVAGSSLNSSLTRTISSPLDLSGRSSVKFDIYASRTGSNIKIGLHDSGGTTTELTPTVSNANTWETKTIDLAGVTNANKDDIDQIIITITNADSANTFYIDNMYSSGEGSFNGLKLVTSGAERLRIDASGMVGIGSTLPTSRLEVVGSGSSATTSSFWTKNLAGTTGIFVNDLGYVGIGTTSPTHALELGSLSSAAAGGIGFGGDVEIYRSSANALSLASGDAFTIVAGSFSTSGGDVNINNNSNFATNINTGTSTGTLSLGGGSGSAAVNSLTWDITSAGAASGFTGFVSSGNIDLSALAAGGLVKADITTGRLSIASSAADYQPLLVFTNGLVKSGTGVTWGGNLTGNTTITQDAAETLTYANSGTGNMVFNLQSTGDFDIQDNGVSAFYVTDAAKVGIGTSAPTSRLEVIGAGSNATTSSFWTKNLAGTTGIFVSDSASYVGIGLTNPAYALDVNGSISGGGVLLNNSGDIGFGATDVDLISLASGAVTINGTLTSTGALNGLTISSGNITAGTWSGDVVNVNKGGTGAATLTANGVLIGAGTGAVTSNTGVGGQLMVISSASIPTFVSLSGDATLSSTGAFTLASTSAIAGTYGNTTNIPTITVDAKGRVTSIVNTAISYESPLTFSNGITRNTNAIKLGGTFTESTTLTAGNFDAIFNMSGTGDFRIQDNGVDVLFVKDDGNVGIGTSNPTYKLTISGSASTSSLFTTDLFISGTQVTATAAEINVLDGINATLTYGELNLLDGRTGTLLDNSNISSYAITSLTAGSGLSGGTGPGATTIDIGAGNGITVGADSISLDIVTTGTSANNNSNSGLELSADGVRLLGGCSSSQVLAWNSSTNVWECKSISTIGSTLSGSGVAGQVSFFTGLNAQSGSNNLFWDNSLSRLGIGLTNPAYELDVNGSILGGGVLLNNAGDIGFGATDPDLISLANTAVTINGTLTTTGAINGLTISSGNITAGTWSGDIISMAKGGTGANLSDPGADRVMFWDESAGTVTWLTVGDGLTITDAIISAVAGTGGTGTITAVGSMTSGAVFANTAADGQWLGLGALAGRIEFDNETINEINLLDAYIGIGTSNPLNRLDVAGGMVIGAYAGLNTAPVNGLLVSGYVGIGTTNPTSPLTVGGTLSRISNSIGDIVFNPNQNVIFNQGKVGIGSSVPTAKLEIVGSGSDSSTSSFWTKNLAGTTGLFINDLGNVGIGTTNPLYNLQIAGSIMATDYFSGDGTIGSSTTVNGLVFKDGLYTSGTFSTGGTGTITAVGSMNTGAAFASASASGQWLGLGATAGRISFTSAATDQINFLTANIGIGTTDPTSKLYVSQADGSSNIAYFTNTANSRSAYVNQWGDIYTDGAGALYTNSIKTHGAGDNLSITSRGTGDIILQDGATGNVGIGTTDPNYKLEVAGDIKASGTIWGSAFSSNSPLLLQTAGTTRIYVSDSSGNIGIGTTNPGKLLDVVGGDIRNNANLISGDLNLGYKTNTGVTYFLAGKAKVMSGEGYLDFSGYNSSVYMDKTTGNLTGYAFLENVGWVALGTQDNASGPVNINLTTGSVTGFALIISTNTYIDFTNYNSDVSVDLTTGLFSGYAFSEDVGWINFTDTGVSFSNTASVTTTASNQQLFIDPNGTGSIYFHGAEYQLTSAGDLTLGSNLTFNTTGDAQITTAATSDLLIMAGGNVGIGTTSPTSRLEVIGSGSDSTTSSLWTKNLAGTTGLFVRDDGNIGIGLTNPAYKLEVAGSIKASGTIWGSAFSSNSPLLLQTAGTTRIYVSDSSGNVGIGNTNPMDMLSVNGYVSALGFRDSTSVTAFNLTLPTVDQTIDFMEYTSDSSAQATFATNITSASGGTITTSGGYTIHTFTSSGTITFTGVAGGAEYLVVAGGGGGGKGITFSQCTSGGGGAGGVKTGTLAVTTGSKTVTVGGGGGGASGDNDGGDGGSSVFDSISTTGGGGGAGFSYSGKNGRSGGSGGGGVNRGLGGSGTGSEGYSGGDSSSDGLTGGGGGGGGGTPAVGGPGGPGINSSISGASVCYAGGGAGGSSGTATCGGGVGGGSGHGTANKGGGGGGGTAADEGGLGGNGGSGIVIVRYPTSSLMSYSSSSPKNQGSYSLKGIAAVTTSLNTSLIRTISSPLDLSGRSSVKFDIYASRTGSNIKIGLHDSGGTTTELTPTVNDANTWETKTIDISGVTNANKDAIDQIIITITNADSENTFYIDNMYSPGVGTVAGLGYITNGVERMRIDSAGNLGLGIGNTSPVYRLDVAATQSAGYVAQISNLDTGTEADGLLINLGVANASRNAGNYFIAFAGAGTVSGKIQGNSSGTSVVYNTTSADYAEYFRIEDPLDKPMAGDVVSISKIVDRGVAKASNLDSSGSNDITGVITNNPGFIGNGPICDVGDNNCDTNYEKTNVLVGLMGQISTKVSTLNGPIVSGDSLTSSSIPGVAVKAIKAGNIIGQALENYEELDPNTIGNIKVYVNPSWYDPSIQIAATGDLEILNQDGTYVLGNSSTGQNIDTVGLFDTVTTANINTGKLDAKEITVNGVSLSDYVLGLMGEVNTTQSTESTTSITDTTSLSSLQTLVNEFKDLVSTLGMTTQVDEIGDKSLVIDSNLNVLGDVSMANLSVSGNIQAGTITIDTINNSMDVLGTSCYNSELDTTNKTLCEVQTLYLQKSGSGNLDIFDGKIVMTPDGNIKVTGDLEVAGIIKAGESVRGTAVIETGQNSIRVTKDWANAPASVVATPKFNTKVWVSDVDTTGFTINTDISVTNAKQPAEIYWIAIW